MHLVAKATICLGCRPEATRVRDARAGCTGSWHAASGNSGGWKQWSIDLSAYRGQQVDISVVFATDWAFLPVPGVMIDDTTVTAGSNVSSTSFETQGDVGGWTVPGAHPAGPSTNVND